MIYWIYNTLLSLLVILSSPVILLAILFTRAIREGLLERAGFYPRQVKDALRGCRPVWVHAASVGEVRAANTLVDEFRKRFPDRKILLSTFTRAGYQMARRSEPSADAVIFLPLDHPWVIGRTLKVFDPALLIFLETEFWPNLLQMAHSRGIPTLLISGRVSPRAFRRYRFFGWFFSRVLRQITTFGMQNQEYAERVRDLGVDSSRVMVTGNLKHADWSVSEAVGTDAGMAVLKPDSPRRVLVAGSTHRGEEEVLLEAFINLKTNIPELLMILAPRHPQRFDEVEKLLQRKNLNYVKKSQLNGHGTTDADIVFLDTLGELPAIYRLAHVVFIGGSLVDAGGHNLIEPARWSKPVLFGPYMTNFSELADEMKQQGGGIEVQGKEDLTRAISMFLSEPEKAVEVGERAKRVVDGDRGVVDRSMGLIGRYL